MHGTQRDGPLLRTQKSSKETESFLMRPNKNLPGIVLKTRQPFPVLVFVGLLSGAEAVGRQGWHSGGAL